MEDGMEALEGSVWRGGNLTGAEQSDRNSKFLTRPRDRGLQGISQAILTGTASLRLRRALRVGGGALLTGGI